MHYHNYIFFDSKESIGSLGEAGLAGAKKQFLALIEKAATPKTKKDDAVLTFSYATLGLKAESRFLLWFQSEKLEEIQLLLNRLMHSALGQHLRIDYTLFGIARPSQYERKDRTKDSANESVKGGPKATGATGTKATAAHDDQTIRADSARAPYLIIYPFTKTKEWHLLPFDQRRSIMIDHIRTAHGFAPIKQLLLYSYGIDDHEFIVSYETGSLDRFQDLVIALRSTEARRHTERDTPIFTCIHQPLEKALDFA